MLKILILNNFFNRNYELIPKILIKFLRFYKKNKLQSVVKSLNKKYNGRLSIKIINSTNKLLETDDFLSDFRISLNQDEFHELKQNMLRATRQTLTKLFKNLLKLRTFNIDRIFIPKLIELFFVFFFNRFFGNYDLLNRLFKKENYDKIILVNCNPVLKVVFQKLNLHYRNIEICDDILLTRSFKLLKWLELSINILHSFFSFIKRKFLKITEWEHLSYNKKKKLIVYFAHTQNQINSVKPVFNLLEKREDINQIFYKLEFFITLKRITALIRFLIQKRRILISNQKEIFLDLKYESLDLSKIIKFFYDSELFIHLIRIFNTKNNLERFFKKAQPKLAIITQDFSYHGRLPANYFSLKKIPTFYISHAAQCIFEEMITKNDFTYTTVSGEIDKNYYLTKGLSKNEIILTGRPFYDIIYRGEIKPLREVKDMFSDRVYKFNSDKFTILLATNDIGRKSTKILISSILNSLKKLNLINNLIIKLHPLEKGMIYKKIFKDLNMNPIVIKDYNILELIKSSNLLLARNSSSLLEGMIIGIPVIDLDLVNVDIIFTSKYLFMEEDIIIKIKEEDDLSEKIRELIDNKEYYIKYTNDLKNLSRRYSFYDENESSAEKITNLIINIIKRDNI